jgi:hypothetical protein
VIINVDRHRNVKQFIQVMNLGQAANPGDLVIAAEHVASK